MSGQIPSGANRSNRKLRAHEVEVITRRHPQMRHWRPTGGDARYMTARHPHIGENPVDHGALGRSPKAPRDLVPNGIVARIRLVA